MSSLRVFFISLCFSHCVAWRIFKQNLFSRYSAWRVFRQNLFSCSLVWVVFGKICSHIVSPSVFSGRICARMLRLERFHAKFLLTLRRGACFVAGLRPASEFSFAREARIFVASRQKVRKLAQVQQKIKIRRILWQKWQR